MLDFGASVAVNPPVLAIETLSEVGYRLRIDMRGRKSLIFLN